MSIRIGIPTGKIFDELVERYDDIYEKYDLQLVRTDDEQLGKLFAAGRLEIAFLSPIAYSLGMGEAEYRIIPETCVALEGYTGEYSILFNRNAREIKTLAAKSETNYLTVITQSVLAERYDIFPEIVETKVDNVPLEELMNKFDTAIIQQKMHAGESALDLSEQWFDSYEFPLIMGFWCVSVNPEHPDEKQMIYPKIIAELARENLEPEVEIIDMYNLAGKDYSRVGNIHYRWNEDIENTLNETLQLLFVLRIYEAVPAVKVFGRNVDPLGNNISDNPEHTHDCEDEDCDCGEHHHHHTHDCEDEDCDSGGHHHHHTHDCEDEDCDCGGHHHEY